MKMIVFLGFVTSLFVSSPNFAMEELQGKLTKHQEIIPVGVIASFKNVSVKTNNNLIKFKKQTRGDGDTVVLKVTANDVEGIIGEDVTLVGHSDITIANETTRSHFYTIRTYICINGDIECAQSIDTLN